MKNSPNDLQIFEVNYNLSLYEPETIIECVYGDDLSTLGRKVFIKLQLFTCSVD